jgi:DNA-binding transcriptional ArsR family regulator
MSLGVERSKATTQLRALAHPIRLRILSLLTGASMTAAEVARELGLTHANASYHLRQLYAAGTIEAAADGPPSDPDRHEVDLRAVYGALATELRRRAKHLTYTLGRSHATDADLWVDLDTWLDVRARVTAASHVLHRSARPPRTAGTIRVNATLALFEMEPDA